MKGKFKRIAAIVTIAILVLMYLLSLIFAVANVPNWQRFFFASMGATIILPAFLWLNMILYKYMMDRRKLDENEEELTHGKRSEH